MLDEDKGVNNGGEPTTPPVVETPEVVNKPGESASAIQPKIEPKAEPQVDTKKFQEQIDNLNIAIQQERENKKHTIEERDSKITALEEQLKSALEVSEKLKSVFTPPAKEESTPDVVTVDRLNELLDQREAKIKEEMTTKQRQELIKQELKEMETTWDGKDGKPKYDDKEVLQWQQEQSKLYLTPKEAFYAMKQADIIDYEAKKRLASGKKPEDVVTPSSAPNMHEPAAIRPKNDLELRSAVLEAMNKADSEM